jgi:hypothetical protein
MATLKQELITKHKPYMTPDTNVLKQLISAKKDSNLSGTVTRNSAIAILSACVSAARHIIYHRLWCIK